jgi:hypothetical protein
LKSLSGANDGRGIKTILLSIFPDLSVDFVNLKSKFANFLEEIVSQPSLFRQLSNKLSRVNMFETKFASKLDFVSIYPIKSSLEDFYRSNNLSKNSITMAQCSQAVREKFNNFKTND